jgi:hypothetical protein
VPKWQNKRLVARLSAGLGVAALMYVGRVCALVAAGLLLVAVVQQAWGVAGAFGMASLAGSVACGIASGGYLKRESGTVGRLVLVAVGAIALMFLGAVLVATQLC